MIQLIVNADDLGSGPRRDRGIFAAFIEGIVTSASLLANGPDFALAAREALACGLPVGVHLNLSEGRALTGPIAGLTDGHGNFPGKAALRSILLAGQVEWNGLRRELLAQTDKVRAAGITSDHLDTHQHCLLFPALTGIVAEVAEQSGIRALRLPFPAEPAGGCPGEADCAACQVDLPSADDIDSAVVPKTDFPRKSVHSPKSGRLPAGLSSAVANELALYRQLAPAARDTLQARNLWTPDGLWGMPLLNRLDTASLADTLARIPAGTWELMTHPGYGDPNDPFGGPEREAELTALTAPEIRRLIDERGIELTSFGACACAC
jgi:predicted glycoside hydrolase/deacetylase ChbG (UPF0249 family)